MKNIEDTSGENGEIGRGKVFFAELDVIDAVGGPLGGLEDESGELWIPLIAMRLR